MPLALITGLLIILTMLALPQNANARATGDYNYYCSDCHGSNKLGVDTFRLHNAINSNRGGMGFLYYLTAAQIDDIAMQGGNPTTCPTPNTWNSSGSACVAAPIVVCSLPTIRNPVNNKCVKATTIISGTLGSKDSGLAATDVYAVKCPSSSQSLSVAVLDMAAVQAPLISIQATKNSAASKLSTDTINGDKLYSPLKKLAKGAGNYKVTVNKSAYTGTGVINNGIQIYNAVLSCQNASGVNINSPKPVITQNQ